LIESGRVAELGAAGLADFDAGRRMSPGTRLNVASVTKTITAAVVAALAEAGSLTFDDALDDHLSFTVRNPAYPDVPISIRQLLTHRSGIRDAAAYEESYSSGNPTVSLESFLRSYLEPHGAAHDRENFHPWPPGGGRAYSNVGFGLLGLVIENIAGTSFAEASRHHVFDPLGMTRSGFAIEVGDATGHATPYTRVADEAAAAAVGLRDPGARSFPAADGIWVAHALYGFPTAPDGLLRSTAADLGRFAAAIAAGGELEGRRFLRRDTVAAMLSADDGDRVGRLQGLAWQATRARPSIWAHSGSDPGVSALVRVRPGTGSAVVLLANGGEANTLLERIADEAVQ
jgi:CubicO group peptidase (beta-lactamase class C family)